MATLPIGTLTIPVDCDDCPQPYQVSIDVDLDGRSDNGAMAIGNVKLDHDTLHRAVRAHMAQHR